MPRHVVRTTLLLALALSLEAPGPVAGTERAPLVRSEQSVTDHYYEVWGTTADAVFASIGRKGLGGVPGRAASGVTEARLSASMQISSTPASCRIEALTLTLAVDVTLPRHGAVASLDAATRENWETYATGVVAHEYEHVDIEERGLAEVKQRLERELAGPALPGPGPDACRRLVDEALEEQRQRTSERHEEFHRREAEWLRYSQDEVRADIRTLDRRLAEQATSIGAFEASLSALDAERTLRAQELSGLLATFGRSLPEPHFSRAQELRAAIDALASDEAAEAERHDQLVAEHRRLADARRERAEELRWIR